MCYFRKKYVSFLSSFWPNICFACDQILVSILHIFGPIYRLVIPTFLSLQINKIESFNFSLVLKRTL